MHISQPTISRDINLIRNQSSSAAKTTENAYRYYYEQQNSLDGVQEVMKNLWLIIDNPKIEVKEKMKAMNLMMQYQIMRLKKVDSEAFNKEFLDYTKKVQNDEETVRIGENKILDEKKILKRAIEDHLKNEKITQERIWEIRDPDVVF